MGGLRANRVPGNPPSGSQSRARAQELAAWAAGRDPADDAARLVEELAGLKSRAAWPMFP